MAKARADDEGVAQAKQVDVGPEPDGGVRAATNDNIAAASKRGVVGGIGGCSCPAWGEPAMATGSTRCSGNQTESNPSCSATTAASVHMSGTHAPEGHGELHVGPPGTAAK